MHYLCALFVCICAFEHSLCALFVCITCVHSLCALFVCIVCVHLQHLSRDNSETHLEDAVQRSVPARADFAVLFKRLEDLPPNVLYQHNTNTHTNASMLKRKYANVCVCVFEKTSRAETTNSHRKSIPQSEIHKLEKLALHSCNPLVHFKHAYNKEQILVQAL